MLRNVLWGIGILAAIAAAYLFVLLRVTETGKPKPPEVPFALQGDPGDVARLLKLPLGKLRTERARAAAARCREAIGPLPESYTPLVLAGMRIDKRSGLEYFVFDMNYALDGWVFVVAWDPGNGTVVDKKNYAGGFASSTEERESGIATSTTRHSAETNSLQ